MNMGSVYNKIKNYRPEAVHTAFSLATAWMLVSVFQLFLHRNSGYSVDNIRFVLQLNVGGTFVLVITIGWGLYMADRILSVSSYSRATGTHSESSGKRDSAVEQDHFRRRLEAALLFAVVFLYGLVTLLSYRSDWFCGGFLLVLCFLGGFCYQYQKGWKASVVRGGAKPASGGIGQMILLGAAAGIFFYLTARFGVVRIQTYSAPNFDCGLFTQMFYSMRKTGRMVTTLERDRALSHMAVHVSPSFYLFLPFYAVVPKAETIAVLQSLFLTLAVIPLKRICSSLKMSETMSVAVCIAYLFYPVLISGTFYDVHENCMLPLFLLAFLDCHLRDNRIGMVISAALTLGVKEDAAVYLMAIAVFIMVTGKKKRGALLLACSCLYFLFTFWYLKTFGDGVISDRFNNMIATEDGNLLEIVRTLFVHPIYLLITIFKEEKIPYMIETIFPLLFLPLYPKHRERFILMLPYVVFNLMPDYRYFHDIGFHYSFASCTMLFFIAVLNLKSIYQEHEAFFGPAFVVWPLTAILFFVSLTGNRFELFKEAGKEYNQKNYGKITAALNQIPSDASVIATTFLCPRLADRDEIYELYYTEQDAEYVALDLRGASTEYSVDSYLNNDRYETVVYETGLIAVFRDKTYSKIQTGK